MQAERFNYHLPKKCCGYCRHSEQNTYDDNVCPLQQPGHTIDMGGCCDQFDWHEKAPDYLKHEAEYPNMMFIHQQMLEVHSGTLEVTKEMVGLWFNTVKENWPQ